MRFKGTLSKWNDERGFGFIRPAEGGPEVFVHVSSFPRGGQRPRLNEVVTFALGQAASGKTRAVEVHRAESAAGGTGRDDTSRTRRGRSPAFGVVSLLILCALGAYGYAQYSRRHATPEEAMGVVSTADRADQESSRSPFSCDGRTHCSQMTSCAEARYFLAHCPGAQMDGNHDGEPCERQWCSGFASD
jgi:cold shock CspA family protein